jgi:hypothetical protein
MKITTPIPGEGNPLFGDRASGSPLSAAFKPPASGSEDARGDLRPKNQPSTKAKIPGPRLRRTSRPR